MGAGDQTAGPGAVDYERTPRVDIRAAILTP